MALDQVAFALLENLPPLPFARLVRPDQAQEKELFFRFTEQGQLPVFSYTKCRDFPLVAYQQALAKTRQDILALPLPQPLHQLYERKLDELKTRSEIIGAIAVGNDAQVTKLSAQLYSQPTESAQELAQAFAQNLAQAKAGKRYHHRLRITADDFMILAQRTLDHYGITGWRIVLSLRDRIRISHGRHLKQPVLRIPKNLHVTKRRAERLLTHEIEAHILRTQNGQQSELKLLGLGCAGYIGTEEGLALHLQNQVGGKKEAPGFWDAWSCALMQERGFVATYTTLKEAREQLLAALGKDTSKAASFAWRMVCRASRGITAPGPAGLGYFRDQVYRSGFWAVRQHLRKQPQDLGLLFAGNCGLSDLPTLQALNIAPGKTPEFVSKRIVKNYCKKKTAS